MPITNDLREFNHWRHFVYGAYTVHDIIQAAQDPTWQRVRLSLKGQGLRSKHDELSDYINRNKTGQGGIPHNIKVQVTNYVLCLRRNGVIR